MVDHLTTQQRSWNMARVKSENTNPERIVRSLLHQAGFRFKLHDKNLPGKPDISLPKYKLAIFVHGCFWHRHNGCADCTTPKSNISFWLNKFIGNVARDKIHKKCLKFQGWKVIIVWECEPLNKGKLAKKLLKRLSINKHLVR